MSRLYESFIVGLRGLKGTIQLVRGVGKVLRLPNPRISIFGGSRSKLDSRSSQRAHLLAHRFAQHDISVLTGGGPGMMEAVSCGVLHEGHENSIGIALRNLPGESGVNPCAKDTIIVDYFWVRKWLLLDFSMGFVVLPGGFGTVDELTELLTLMQTKKIAHAPVILLNADYWKPWMMWASQAEKDGYISAEEYAWLMVTDDLDLVVTTILKHCQRTL